MFDPAILATISNFNYRVAHGPSLMEFEMLMYEQLCRLIETNARAARLQNERWIERYEDEVQRNAPQGEDDVD